MLRSNTWPLTALRVLYHINTALLSDYRRYLVCLTHSNSGAQRTLDHLQKNDYATVYRHDILKTDLITITRRGRVALIDKLNDHRLSALDRSYPYSKSFSTTDRRRLESSLSTSRAVLAFESIGVPSIEPDKPTLRSVLDGHAAAPTSGVPNFVLVDPANPPTPVPADSETPTLRQSPSLIQEIDPAPDDTSDLQSRLRVHGFFYTAQEYRDAFRSKSQGGMISVDQIASSRFKGIYLSEYTCLVVYDTTTANRRSQLYTPVESRLLDHLRENLRKTRVLRPLPLSDDKGSVHGEPYALVFTTGTKTIVEMTTGYKDGHISKQSLKRRDEGRIPPFAKSILGIDTDIFRRIFAVPMTRDGMWALEYLTHHSYEEYQSDTADLLELAPEGEYAQVNPRSISPYVHKRNEVTGRSFSPTIHLPVYECRLIASLTGSETIIASPDMVKTIAHSSAGAHEFINSETMTPYGRDFTYIFARTGIPAGQQLILDELESRGADAAKCFPTSRRTAFAKEHGYNTPQEFYNKIYREEIAASSLADELDARTGISGEGPAGRSVHHRAKPTTITLDEELRENLRKACRLKQTSMTRYIKSLIRPQAEADAKAYDDFLKQDRERRRQNR